MTDALERELSLSARGINDRNETIPSQRTQRRSTETEKAANSCTRHDKPDSVHGRLSVWIDLFPPSRARQRIITGECEDNARGIHTLCSACSELGDVSFDRLTSAAGSSHLHDDNTTPYRKHSVLTGDVEEQLAHWQRKGGGQEIRNRRRRKRSGDVNQPA